MPHTAKSESRPRLACEITAGSVIAARADDGRALDVYTARTLPTGTLAPNLTVANVADGNALRQTLADALATVGGRSRDVTAVLPDAAARVVLLDFDTLPEKRQDADAVVRFRLKKSLPFDVDKAAVAFESAPAEGGVRVVAAVTLASVLQEYEAAFRDVGYQPGVVMPAMLAALGPLDTAAPILVIKVDATTTGVAIVEGGQLLLVRTLENASAGIDPQRLAEEVYPSLVFFQDTYGKRVERILVGGVVGVEQVGPALLEQTGIHAQELVAAAQVGSTGSVPRSLLAGVVGALLG